MILEYHWYVHVYSSIAIVAAQQARAAEAGACAVLQKLAKTWAKHVR
jgi:hypothetical protein